MSYGPCLCGAPDCARCFPAGQQIVECSDCGVGIKVCDSFECANPKCSAMLCEECIAEHNGLCEECFKDRTVKNMKKVYAAQFCECIHESSYYTMSLHTTKAGAYRAIRRSKLREWDDSFGGIGWDHMAWRIEEYEVIDN